MATYKLYGGATRSDAISGLEPQFWSALESMYAAAPPSVQAELGLNSGYRSIERQRQLWEASDKSGKMVARPGHSRHNHGLAADLWGFGLGNGQKVSPETRDWVHANAGKYGMHFPIDYEPWHIQWQGAGGGNPLASPYATMPDGPKGQESYPQPVQQKNDAWQGMRVADTPAPKGVLDLLKGAGKKIADSGLLESLMEPPKAPQMAPMQAPPSNVPALPDYVQQFLASRRIA